MLLPALDILLISIQCWRWASPHKLLPARADENWKPDLEALVANGKIPDGLLLANPANPTGVVISDVELEVVCPLVRSAWCSANYG